MKNEEIQRHIEHNCRNAHGEPMMDEQAFYEGAKWMRDKALSLGAVSGSYYLVRYYGGSYDDYYSAVVFVTNKKSTATKYCSKFNKALKKWKSYYEQFETDKFGMKWIADEHVEKHFDRWNSLRNITKCYYEEVSFR